MQPGGQSLVDRLLAAKNTIAGQALAKVVCKATTEEIMGPKRKHLECKLIKDDVDVEEKTLRYDFVFLKFFFKQRMK